MDLPKFIHEKFYETTNQIKGQLQFITFIRIIHLNITCFLEPGSPLIRSLSACQLDLRRWGAQFKNNSQRPYFEGHQRNDVVAHRQQFIHYFLDRKDSYYTVAEGEKPIWQFPSQKPPCILICE